MFIPSLSLVQAVNTLVKGSRQLFMSNTNNYRFWCRRLRNVFYIGQVIQCLTNSVYQGKYSEVKIDYFDPAIQGADGFSPRIDTQLQPRSFLALIEKGGIAYKGEGVGGHPWGGGSHRSHHSISRSPWHHLTKFSYLPLFAVSRHKSQICLSYRVPRILHYNMTYRLEGLHSRHPLCSLSRLLWPSCTRDKLLSFQ